MYSLSVPRTIYLVVSWLLKLNCHAIEVDLLCFQATSSHHSFCYCFEIKYKLNGMFYWWKLCILRCIVGILIDSLRGASCSVRFVPRCKNLLTILNTVCGDNHKILQQTSTRQLSFPFLKWSNVVRFIRAMKDTKFAAYTSNKILNCNCQSEYHCCSGSLRSTREDRKLFHWMSIYLLYFFVRKYTWEIMAETLKKMNNFTAQVSFSKNLRFLSSLKKHKENVCFLLANDVIATI